jgi:hypothetical protein
MRCSELALLLLIGCEHRPPAPSAAASATRAPVPLPGTGTGTAAPPVATVRLVSRPQGGAQVWDVIALASGTGSESTLAQFELPGLCGTVLRPAGAGSAPQSWLTCPGRPPIRLEGATSLPLLEQPPPPRCGPASSLRRLDVRLNRSVVARSPAREPKYAFSFQVGGDSIALTEVPQRPMRCAGSRAFLRTKSFQETCSWGESGARIRIDLEESKIWLQWVDTGYGPDSPRLRVGFQLACGDQPVFHPLTLQDSGFRVFGDACSDGCGQRQVSCADDCYARFADDTGSLSTGGGACLDTCSHRQALCGTRCRAAPKQP